MSDDKNPREELYNRFRRSLSQPVGERYFDEDELVEVYDYAGDLSDDYVQMEALFCGARLYPDSMALSERRALLYLDTSIDDSDKPSPAAGEYLTDNAERLSPIFDIARLEVNRPDDPVAALEFMLNQYDTFSDEEVIRFVDLAFDLDCYDWLKEKLPALRKKIAYQPVLVYEMMQVADDMLDNEFMAVLAEELIEDEPFSVQYWITLYKAHARAGKEEDARSAFDYARALGADDAESLLMLADVTYNFAPYLYSEAYDILDGLRAEKPDDFIYVDCQCALLARAGSSAAAVKLLRDFLDTHPSDARAMRQLLVCNAPEAAACLDRFYDATEGNGFDEDNFAEIINTLSMNSASRSIVALMDHYVGGHEVSPNDFNTWVEALFSLGRHERVVQLIDGYIATAGKESFLELMTKVPLRGTATSMAYMVSLMKAGRQADAEAHYADVSSFVETLMGSAPMPIRMAARCLQTLADKIRQHPATDTLYWQYFDMLSYSKFQ